MNPLDIDRLRRAFPGRRIDYYAAIDSTMQAAAGRQPGAVVVAERQTAGQGRFGRSWHSEPGAGIYCSLVLEPMRVLTLALGLAAQSAILEATGIHCDLRWPNDLLLDDKKVAGILVQLSGDKAIAGIGINVSNQSFPPGLEATSLALWGRHSRQSPGFYPAWSDARELILLALLPAIDRFTQLDMPSILRLFTQASTYVRGRRVVVHQAGGAIEGVTAGLDPAGFLVVRQDNGTDTLVLAGGVRAAGS